MSVETLIGRLAAIFGEPKTDAPEVFLAEYRRALGGYSSEVLTKAGDRVINDSVYWPRPSEVRKVAASVAAEIQASKRYYIPLPEHKPIVSNEATEAGKDAVREVFKEYLQSVASRALEAKEPTKLHWPSMDEFKAMQASSPNHGLHRARGHR